VFLFVQLKADQLTRDFISTIGIHYTIANSNHIGGKLLSQAFALIVKIPAGNNDFLLKAAHYRD